jgi:glycosyltransferase involved in cell wall biosynthesis
MDLPDDAIRITGPVSQIEMPALYRAASVLVFPSVTEGFGLAVLEAAASGIPVITSRIAPFTEYLDDGDAAWCNPYDIISISDAILRALEPTQRHALIACGRQVAARHSWQLTAAAHLHVYAAMREMQDA